MEEIRHCEVCGAEFTAVDDCAWYCDRCQMDSELYDETAMRGEQD